MFLIFICWVLNNGTFHGTQLLGMSENFRYINLDFNMYNSSFLVRNWILLSYQGWACCSILLNAGVKIARSLAFFTQALYFCMCLHILATLEVLCQYFGDLLCHQM